jgi:hypothetical protein
MTPTRRDGHERLWVPVLPLVIWALHMLICYVAAALACGPTRPFPAPAFNRLVVVATLVAVTLIVWLGATAARRHGAWRSAVPDHAASEDRGRFIAFTTLLLAGLSLLGVVWVAWSTVLVGACT